MVLRTLSDRKNMTVIATLYELTVHAEDVYVGIDEIVGQSKLSNESAPIISGSLTPEPSSEGQSGTVT